MTMKETKLALLAQIDAALEHAPDVQIPKYKAPGQGGYSFEAWLPLNRQAEAEHKVLLFTMATRVSFSTGNFSMSVWNTRTTLTALRSKVAKLPTKHEKGLDLVAARQCSGGRNTILAR